MWVRWPTYEGLEELRPPSSILDGKRMSVGLEHYLVVSVLLFCLGLLGDVYLMLPVDLFIPGLAAFLVGHLAYIADFHAALGWRLVCPNDQQ